MQVANCVQKYGRPNEATPAKWQEDYKDFNAPLENGTIEMKAEPVTKEESMEDAPAVAAPVESPPAATAGATAASEDAQPKKRKKHEGETPEERAERKRRKKEKKEKRKSKAAGSDDDE